MHPVYTSTYERFDGVANNGRSRTRAYVARKASWVLDARRALDYLETRSEIDPERLAYWGFGWGAEIAPITLAVDARTRAAVLMDGGASLVPVLADADEANFVPRITVPVLMINGRYDYVFPVETAQRPFFELLGTPADRKRHEIFDSGHVVSATLFDEVMSLMVEWLDGVFGPVQ
jgi:dienelactone hydrolase